MGLIFQQAEWRGRFFQSNTGSEKWDKLGEKWGG